MSVIRDLNDMSETPVAGHLHSFRNHQQLVLEDNDDNVPVMTSTSFKRNDNFTSVNHDASGMQMQEGRGSYLSTILEASTSSILPDNVLVAGSDSSGLLPQSELKKLSGNPVVAIIDGNNDSAIQADVDRALQLQQDLFSDEESEPETYSSSGNRHFVSAENDSHNARDNAMQRTCSQRNASSARFQLDNSIVSNDERSFVSASEVLDKSGLVLPQNEDDHQSENNISKSHSNDISLQHADENVKNGEQCSNLDSESKLLRFIEVVNGTRESTVRACEPNSQSLSQLQQYDGNMISFVNVNSSTPMRSVEPSIKVNNDVIMEFEQTEGDQGVEFEMFIPGDEKNEFFDKEMRSFEQEHLFELVNDLAYMSPKRCEVAGDQNVDFQPLLSGEKANDFLNKEMYLFEEQNRFDIPQQQSQSLSQLQQYDGNMISFVNVNSSTPMRSVEPSIKVNNDVIMEFEQTEGDQGVEFEMFIPGDEKNEFFDKEMRSFEQEHLFELVNDLAYMSPKRCEVAGDQNVDFQPLLSGEKANDFLNKEMYLFEEQNRFDIPQQQANDTYSLPPVPTAKSGSNNDVDDNINSTVDWNIVNSISAYCEQLSAPLQKYDDVERPDWGTGGSIMSPRYIPPQRLISPIPESSPVSTTLTLTPKTLTKPAVDLVEEIARAKEDICKSTTMMTSSNIESPAVVGVTSPTPPPTQSSIDNQVPIVAQFMPSDQLYVLNQPKLFIIFVINSSTVSRSVRLSIENLSVFDFSNVNLALAKEDNQWVKFNGDYEIVLNPFMFHFFELSFTPSTDAVYTFDVLVDYVDVNSNLTSTILLTKSLRVRNSNIEIELRPTKDGYVVHNNSSYTISVCPGGETVLPNCSTILLHSLKSSSFGKPTIRVTNFADTSQDFEFHANDDTASSTARSSVAASITASSVGSSRSGGKLVAKWSMVDFGNCHLQSKCQARVKISNYSPKDILLNFVVENSSEGSKFWCKHPSYPLNSVKAIDMPVYCCCSKVGPKYATVVISSDDGAVVKVTLKCVGVM